MLLVSNYLLSYFIDKKKINKLKCLCTDQHNERGAKERSVKKEDHYSSPTRIKPVTFRTPGGRTDLPELMKSNLYRNTIFFNKKIGACVFKAPVFFLSFLAGKLRKFDSGHLKVNLGTQDNFLGNVFLMNTRN